MKRLVVAAALISMCAMAVSGPTNLTRRFALDLNKPAPYYSLTVPRAVYAASLRGDLGDLRVLNGANEPVPYSLETPSEIAPVNTVRRTVRWFPLPRGEAAGSTMPLGVSIAPDGTLRAASVSRHPTERPDADIVDLESRDRSDAVLVVRISDNTFQGRVIVEASDNLRTWRQVSEAQLLKLDHGGAALVQDRIELDAADARYLRLRWPDGAPDIASIDIESRERATNARTEARQWRDMISVRAGKAAGEYAFGTGGRYPVDRLNFTLPQLNTITRAVVYSRIDATMPWREIGAGTLYRISSEHGEIVNPPFEVTANSDPEWRMVVDMRNGGLGSGAVEARVGWRPAALTFIARGAGPFLLAVGNSDLTSASLSSADLLLGASPEIAVANVGAELPALARAPEPGPEREDPDSHRRGVLWAALVFAVGVLGFIAYKLARGGPVRDGDHQD